MDVSDIARHVGDAVAPVDGVAAVYLFGSVAAGTDTLASDVDLGNPWTSWRPRRRWTRDLSISRAIPSIG